MRIGLDGWVFCVFEFISKKKNAFIVDALLPEFLEELFSAEPMGSSFNNLFVVYTKVIVFRRK